MTSYEGRVIDRVLASPDELFAVANRYPTLIADRFFMEQLRGIENYEGQLVYFVEQYNDLVTKYNTEISKFPHLIAASLFGFKMKDLKQTSELREAPEGTIDHREDSRSRRTELIPSRAVERTSSSVLVLHIDGRTVRLTATKRNLNARWIERYTGDDSKYWSQDSQLDLVKEGNDWFVIPSRSATNDTMLNDKKIASKVQLSEGDVLGVGKEIRGILKTPMRVSFSD